MISMLKFIWMDSFKCLDPAWYNNEEPSYSFSKKKVFIVLWYRSRTGDSRDNMVRPIKSETLFILETHYIKSLKPNIPYWDCVFFSQYPPQVCAYLWSKHWLLASSPLLCHHWSMIEWEDNIGLYWTHSKLNVQEFH